MTDPTAAARQAAFRQRRREEGLVELRLYVTEDHARLIREYAETLKEGADTLTRLRAWAAGFDDLRDSYCSGAVEPWEGQQFIEEGLALITSRPSRD